jgi:hypothetical protein
MHRPVAGEQGERAPAGGVDEGLELVVGGLVEALGARVG